MKLPASSTEANLVNPTTHEQLLELLKQSDEGQSKFVEVRNLQLEGLEAIAVFHKTIFRNIHNYTHLYDIIQHPAVTVSSRGAYIVEGTYLGKLAKSIHLPSWLSSKFGDKERRSCGILFRDGQQLQECKVLRPEYAVLPLYGT